MQLAIIIVNYNTKQLCENCVRSVLATTLHTTFEIVVVDNSSKREERYLPPAGATNVRCIVTPNKGFGNACNIGIRASDAQFYLMLNSDTIVYDGTIDQCVDYMTTHANIGALGCKVTLGDGSLDHGCKRGFPTPRASMYYFLGFDRRFPSNPKFGRYRQTYLPDDEINEVEVISGSFMMLERGAIHEVGVFDEAFFMYGEDVDLCYRLKRAGYKILYYPKAQILHLRGQSGLASRNKKVIYHFYHSMLIFYRKHYRKRYPFFVNWTVYAAIHLKMLAARIKSIIGGN